MPSLSSSPLSPATSAALMTLRDNASLDRAAQATKLDAAAHDFESMFISEMLKPMMESVEVDDMFGGGKGEEIFRSFLTQEYGKKMAAIGGIGLASTVKEALIRAQGEQNMPISGMKGTAK